MHVIPSRLPSYVKKSCEIERSLVNIPVWHPLREFIESRIYALDILDVNKPNITKHKQPNRTSTHIYRAQD